MIQNHILVVDLETGSADASSTQIVQVAALAIDSRTLKPFPGGEFESLMRPWDMDAIQDEALRVNKKTREQLETAPSAEEVWAKFVAYCKQWNLGGKADAWSAPIMGSFNGQNFDKKILDRYCHKFGTIRRNARLGIDEQALLHVSYHYDVYQMLATWFESLREPSRMSLDYLRKFFAMKAPEGGLYAHDALQDVRDTAALLIRLLEMQRKLAANRIWKDSFDPEKYALALQAKAAKKKPKEAVA